MTDVQVSNARRVTIGDGLRFGILRPAKREFGGSVDQLSRATRITIGGVFRFAVGLFLALGVWYLLVVVLVLAAIWHWMICVGIVWTWIGIGGGLRWRARVKSARSHRSRDENPKDRTVMGDELEPFDDDRGFDLFD